jgi:ubiquinol-cytochrome c reductase cytochrome c subunit
MTRLLALALLLGLALAGAAPAATGPPATGIVQAPTGAGLYAANCSSCHGPHGEGVPPPGRPGAGDVLGLGPALGDVGAAAVDFYLRTGYMPLADPYRHPSRSPVLFSDRQIRQLVAYVASLGHGPPIPHPNPSAGSLSRGFKLFEQHCAGCHQIVAEGGYVTGTRVPPLAAATNIQIAEAVRTGPNVMPQFKPETISKAELDSIVRYVDYAKHPDDPGGWAIGHIGPVPEGLVTWLIAATLLVAVCLMLGRRARHE